MLILVQIHQHWVTGSVYVIFCLYWKKNGKTKDLIQNGPNVNRSLGVFTLGTLIISIFLFNHSGIGWCHLLWITEMHALPQEIWSLHFLLLGLQHITQLYKIPMLPVLKALKNKTQKQTLSFRPLFQNKPLLASITDKNMVSEAISVIPQKLHETLAWI